MKSALLPFVFVFAVARAFAADGQILINQATVMAGGGFPYVISQPGSYKLSGNLSMTTTAQGNYLHSSDIAILISSGDITLDLNGFAITVTDTFGSSLSHRVYAIAESAAWSQVTIANGMVRISSPTITVFVTPIGMPTSNFLTIENMNVLVQFTGVVNNGLIGNPGALIIGGQFTRARHNAGNGAISLTCPSVAVENTTFGAFSNGGDPSSCIFANNTPLP